ncbi:MAG: serine/threonine protein kinase [Phycisphaerae bacterium]|nr:serine/threonine protein kinase [Phycisphaerae bacterium]
MSERHDRIRECSTTGQPASEGETTPILAHPMGRQPGRLPARLGAYRILRLLGEGGMGAVYEAEQDRPNRRVALKVIRSGLASGELIRRFEQEAEVLGRLQHPGIAQVFDAGVITDVEAGGHAVASIPYFAMELIRGVPLSRHVIDARLTHDQRLGLLARIADAVEHAHQRGVIHRDLKPGNILVDEAGHPKILDFGVARLTDSDIRTTTIRTDIGQLIGTVPYMSPEQAAGDPAALDTRSDVYALGVIGYELLAGRLPYDLSRRPITEAVRIIREQDPERLSTTHRSLRGDVETIIAKALEKEKERRYASAGELAADIRRYLASEPIVARPASTMYQLRKFARRNRALVGGIGATMLALAIGLVLAVQQARVARRERDDARAARAEADQKRAIAEAVVKFQDKMFASIDPSEMMGRDPTVRQVLERAEANLDKEYAAFPLVRARLHDTLGTAYHELRDDARAETHLRAALDLRRAALGEASVEAAQSKNALANHLQQDNRPEDALALFREAGDVFARVLGPNDRLTISVECNIASALSDLGRYDEAERIFSENYRKRLAHFKADDPETYFPLANRMTVRVQQGRWADAEGDAREALSGVLARQNPDHPSVLQFRNNLIGVLIENGKLDEALAESDSVIEARVRVLGPDHPDTLMSMQNKATALQRAGRAEEAVGICRDLLDRQRARDKGIGEPLVLAINNLGAALSDLKRDADAEPLFREGLEVCDRTWPDGHWIKGLIELGLAGTIAVSNPGEAERLLLAAHARLADNLGPDHPYTRLTAKNLSDLFGLQGRAAEAESWRAKAGPVTDAAGAKDPPPG